YSTGMQARLTFATAVSIDPEIFIVDEALAAGDAYFVSKCIKRIHEICSSGATVLFVSHGTAQVAQLCNTAIWLQDGRIRGIGPARDITRQYDYEVHVRISNTAGHVVEVPVEPEVVGPEQLPPLAIETAAASRTDPPHDRGVLADLPDAAENSADEMMPDLPAEAPRSPTKAQPDSQVLITKVAFCDERGEAREVFRTWDTLRIDVHYTSHGR